jgi:hypothetical protein
MILMLAFEIIVIVIGEHFWTAVGCIRVPLFLKREMGAWCLWPFQRGRLSSVKPMINLYSTKIGINFVYFAPMGTKWPNAKPRPPLFVLFSFYYLKIGALIAV